MRIRQAVSSDVSKLFALEGTLFAPQNFPLSRGSFAYHVKNGLVFVAEQDGVVAGYALALVKRANAKLYSIGVGKAFRGKKIAQKLLSAIIDELVAMGFKIASLEVRTDNESAIALYESFGFGVKKVAKGFYLDGCDAFVMERELIQSLPPILRAT
jgi:[ribosomal protein S18]-alanine N-acetyltransferase